MAQVNLPTATRCIAAREPFKGSNLYGYVGTNGIGILRGEDLERMRADATKILYSVYSYATPIGWYTDENGWYRVKMKFSPTTSRHQGCIPLDGTK